MYSKQYIIISNSNNSEMNKSFTHQIDQLKDHFLQKPDKFGSMCSATDSPRHPRFFVNA